MINDLNSQDLSNLIPINIYLENIHHVIYRFTEDVIDRCSNRNNIDARRIAENHELLLFLKYWIDQNPTYQDYFEEQVGRQLIKREGIVFGSSVNSLFMFLVMDGKIPVIVREHGKKNLIRMGDVEDLSLIGYNKQVTRRYNKQDTEKNDDRLMYFYQYFPSIMSHDKKNKKFYRNVRGIINIIGKYQEIVRHFGREVSYDDFENKKLGENQ